MADYDKLKDLMSKYNDNKEQFKSPEDINNFSDSFMPKEDAPVSDSGKPPLTPEELATMGSPITNTTPQNNPPLNLPNNPSLNLPNKNQTPELSDIEKSLQEYKRLKGDTSDLDRAATIDAIAKFGQDFAKYGAMSGQAAAMQAGNKVINTGGDLKFDRPDILKTAREDRTKELDRAAKEVESLRKLKKEGELTPYQKQMVELKKKNQDRLSKQFSESKNATKENRSRLKNQYIQSKVVDFTKQAEKSDTYKSSQKMLDSLKTVKTLAKDARFKGGQSLAMLGSVVARGIAGEVGVLTDADVTRYVKNPSLVGGTISTLKRLKEGKYDKVSYENLMRMTKIMQEKAKDNRSLAYHRKAIQMSRQNKIPYEKSRILLDPNYNKSPYGYSVEKNGKKYVWDGNIYRKFKNYKDFKVKE